MIYLSWSIIFQGTFLVGQPAQGSAKQGGSGSAGHSVSSSAAATQQAIRVTAGQKAAILAQVSLTCSEVTETIYVSTSSLICHFT